MEPSESQYLIVNALTTLDLLGNTFYDEESGNWYINTPSQVLPIAMILQNGDIVPTSWDW
ncbi:hypothetical protein BV372_18240 [Nostoc sp. T09]|uniref:hypothetical protein n=1 Tax=Nostoc sp. T09 TaxID=1932621 RepID=UPI000A35DF0E|nr:hypothetical protein [Nostoc sp. T09]OUL32790.1 hypothetical protein BV372_18240 [Nostoc sp. T09]